MSNPKKIEHLDPATNLQDDDLLFASVRDSENRYVSKKVTLKDIADYVRSGMADDIEIEEPIVIEDEPVSTTKASIGGAATCTASTSSSSTSLTLNITRKTPDDASLQYAISTSKTSIPTSWTDASIANDKLTLSISFTAKTT